MVQVTYSFCSLAPLKWAPECFLVIFFRRHSCKLSSFLSGAVFRCYIKTDSLSCFMAEHAKYFAIIATAVDILPISRVRGPYEDPLLALRRDRANEAKKVLIVWLC